jgi:hypothetical protein
MGMWLRNSDAASQPSLRKLAVANFIPDVGQQCTARVLESQNALSLYFSLK